MKVLALVVLSFFHVAVVKCSQYHYEVKAGYTPLSSGVAEFKKISKEFCLIECTNNDNCTTCEFNEALTGVNCFLYNKHFGIDKLTASPKASMFTKLCAKNNFAGCKIENSELMTAFQFSAIRYKIVSYGSKTFGGLKNFYKSSDRRQHAFDQLRNEIAVFDEKWNFVKYVQAACGTANYIQMVDDTYLLAANDRMCRITSNDTFYDVNFSSNNASGTFQAMNQLGDLMYVTNYKEKSVDVFAANLTRINQISLSSFNCSPYSLFTYGTPINQLYIGCVHTTANSTVLILNLNTSAAVSIPTSCSSIITSILVDSKGCMALACSSDKQLRLYHANGTDLKMSMSLTDVPEYVDFDLNGRLVINTPTSINVFY